MSQQMVSKSRSWLWTGLFVWSLTAVVAVAAFQGKSGESQRTGLKEASLPKLGPTPKKIIWEKDFESAIARAKRENKPIMVDFYADWCSACKHLDANIYTSPDVRQVSTAFVSVKVNTEKRVDLAQTYAVGNLPTVAFVRSDGRPLVIESGAPQQSPLFVEWMQNARQRFASQG